MAGRWWRCYDEAMDDPKLLMLSDSHHRIWHLLMCQASKNNGEITGDLATLSVLIRRPVAKLRDTLQVLLSARLLDRTETGYTPHNWNGRQYKSDVTDPTSSRRQKAYRDRNANRNANRNATVTVERPDTESDTETEAEKKKEASAGADGPAVAVRCYNAVAKECGWTEVQRLTPSRLSAIKQRLGECGGIEGWSAAMARARASPFLRGETGRSRGHENWRPDFDFFTQIKSFTKLMEGGFDARPDGNRKAEPNGFDALVAGARDAARAARSTQAGSVAVASGEDDERRSDGAVVLAAIRH